jgi:hypothetical protein
MKEDGDSPIDVIKKSIDKNWDGLFPLKGGMSGKTKPRKIVSRQFDDKESKLS